MASRVSAMSVTTPSVRMSRMWYRWSRRRGVSVGVAAFYCGSPVNPNQELQTPNKPCRCVRLRLKGTLTEASLMLPSPAASLAILVMMGETLVGPYSWILGRQFW